jgi:hypothetical protein
MSRSLTVSFKAGKEWSAGAIFVRGLAGLWRRFGTSLGMGGLVLPSRSHGHSVVIMKKNVEERTVNV